MARQGEIIMVERMRPRTRGGIVRESGKYFNLVPTQISAIKRNQVFLLKVDGEIIKVNPS